MAQDALRLEVKSKVSSWVEKKTNSNGIGHFVGTFQRWIKVTIGFGLDSVGKCFKNYNFLSKFLRKIHSIIGQTEVQARW